jgi:hypothetical protein
MQYSLVKPSPQQTTLQVQYFKTFVIFVITLQEKGWERLQNSVADIGFCEHVIIFVTYVTRNYWTVVIYYISGFTNHELGEWEQCFTNNITTDAWTRNQNEEWLTRERVKILFCVPLPCLLTFECFGTLILKCYQNAFKCRHKALFITLSNLTG